MIKRIYLILFFSITCLWANDVVNDILIIPNAYFAPTIDEQIDDMWKNVSRTWLTLEGDASSESPQDWWDCSVWFKIVRNGDDLYFLGYTRDNNLNQDPTLTFNNPHNYDSWEIFIDGNNAKDNYYADNNDWHIIFPYSSDNASHVKIYNGNYPTTVNTNSDGINYKIWTDSYGFYIELHIKQEQVNLLTTDESNFGLEIQYNDNDGGSNRQSVLKWSNISDNSSSDPSSFGSAKLSNIPTADVLPILKASFIPTIDGIVDQEWEKIPSISSNLFAAWDDQETYKTSENDNRFITKLSWDDDHLYVLIEAFDNILRDKNDNPTLNDWDVDGMDIFFDGNNSKIIPQETSTENWDGDDVQLRYVINQAYTSGLQDGYGYQETSNGWIQEISFPLENLGIEPFAGKTFGLDFQKNDNDNNYRSGMEYWWSGSNDNWFNPSLWGTAILMDENSTLGSPSLVLDSQTFISKNTAIVEIEISTLGLYTVVTPQLGTSIDNLLDNGQQITTTGDTHTVSFTFTDLTPNTAYYYNFSLQNEFEGNVNTPVNSFTTNDDINFDPTDIIVSKAVYPPEIDAQIDSIWKSVGKNYMYKVGDDQNSRPDDFMDCSGWYKLMYDDNCLYFYGRIYDDNIRSTAGYAQWTNDSWEFFIDGDNSKSIESFTNDDFQFLFNYHYTDTDQINVHQGSLDQANFNTDNIKFDKSRTSDGWDLEVAFPLEDLGIQPQEDLEFGWEAQIDERDSGTEREFFLKWYNTTNESTNDPSIWGTAKLSAHYASDAYVIDKVANGSVTIDGNIDPMWNDIPPISENQWTFVNISELSEMKEYFDNCFQSRFCWDDNNLYALLIGIDDQKSTKSASETGYRDGFRLFIDAGNEKSNETDNNDINIFIDIGEDAAGTAISDYAYTDQNYGWIQEIAFSLNDMQIINQPGLEFIGFELWKYDGDITTDNQQTIGQWSKSLQNDENIPTGFGNSLLFDPLNDIWQEPTTTVQNIDSTENSLTFTVDVLTMNLPTTVIFEFGETDLYSFSVNATKISNIDNTTSRYQINFSQLNPGTTYHYRLVTQNSLGKIIGNDQTIQTLMGPVGSASPLMISKALYAPTIDGQMDDIWKNCQNNYLLKHGDYPAESLGAPENWFDCAGWFKLLYDDDNLYFWGTIQDESIRTGLADRWQNDSWEFFFDGDNSKGDTNDNSNDYQIHFNYNFSTQSDLEIRRGMWNPESGASLPTNTITFKKADNEFGWDFEASIDLDFLQINPQSDWQFGFETQIDDRDGTSDLRESYLKWWNADNSSWANPSMLGTVQLTNHIVGDILSIQQVSNGAIIIDGEVDDIWKNIPAISDNQFSTVISGTIQENQDNIGWVELASENDTRFTCRQYWDSENFYILFEGYDDSLNFNIGGSVWENDCFNLYFDGNNSKLSNYDEDDLQLRIRENEPIEPIRVSEPVSLSPISSSFKQTTYGWIHELGIKLSDLGLQPENGHFFGYEIDKNENDGIGFKNVKQWWGDIASWKNTSQFGTAMLWDGQSKFAAPSIQTPETDITDQTTVTLAVNIVTFSLETEAKLDYGGTTSYGQSVEMTETDQLNDSTAIYSTTLTNLDPNTTYHYRITSSNIFGTTQSEDNTFSTGENGNGILQISKALYPPTIDGDMDDIWKNVPKNYLLKNGTPDSDMPENWFDCGGWFKLLYDDENLYFWGTIQDESITTGHANYWEDDSWELFFDADNSKASQNDLVNDYHIHFNYDYTNISDLQVLQGGTASGQVNPTKTIPENTVFFEKSNTDFGWNFEASIDLEFLQIQPQPGWQFGFESQIDDRDGSSNVRNSYIKWWESDNASWRNPSMLGTAELTDHIVSDVLFIPLISDGAITIDGEIDEAWLNCPVICDNEFSTVQEDNSVTFDSIGWKKLADENDTRFTCRQYWDNENIYILFEGFDDQLYFNQANTPYKNDCLELFFDGNNSKTLKQDQDDVQIRIRENYPIDYFNTSNININFPIERVYAQTQYGWLEEVSIKLSDLSIASENGYIFGYDIQKNENDGTSFAENCVTWWADSALAWQDTRARGTAILWDGQSKMDKPDIKNTKHQATTDSATISTTISSYNLPTVVTLKYGLSTHLNDSLSKPSFKTNNDTTITFNLTSLDQTQTYSYQILATNVLGTAEYDSSFSTNETMEVKIRPELIHTPPTVTEHESPAVNAVFTDYEVIETASLLYRQGGDTTWANSVEFVLTDTIFTAQIPPNSITNRGLEYRITVTDTNGMTFSFPADTTTLNYFCRQVEFNAIQATVPQPAMNYRLVSFPGKLEDTAVSLLTDALGEYDPYNWRLFRYLNNQNYEYGIGGWQEPESGESFWLITNDSVMITSGAGKSIPTDSSFVITLQPGWNQISNPYTFPVSWNSVEKSGALATTLHSFLGTYNHYTNGWKSNNTVLNPWEGYFVANNSENVETIKIPPIAQIGHTQTGLAKNRAKKDWEIEIIAKSESFVDTQNVIGELQKASDNWDTNDTCEPPAFFEDFRFYFPHKDWQKPLKNYQTDFRSPNEEGHIWEAVLESQIGQDISISSSGFENMTKNYEMKLLDLQSNISHNLGEKPYTFRTENQIEKYHFKIIIGTEQFLAEHDESFGSLPTVFALYNNYPNPFNPVTFIEYDIAEATDVTLNIFNIRGQLVKTVMDKFQNPGRYKTTWDGTDKTGRQLATGVYLYVIKTHNYTSSKKMLYIK